jgi:3-hydroxyacyl-CoA dehydrogenase
MRAVKREIQKGRITVANNGEIQNVAIVGTGVIGASWAAYYLSRGFNVIATDPAPNAEAKHQDNSSSVSKTKRTSRFGILRLSQRR